MTISQVHDVEKATGILGLARDSAVEAQEGGWTRIPFSPGKSKGAWVRLVYEVSFFCPVRRPQLRFVSAHGVQDVFLTAAIFGKGEWVGRVPAGVTNILIKISDDAAAIRILRIDPLKSSAILSKALKGNVGKTFDALVAKVRGLGYEAEEELTYALAGTPFSKYHNWRIERQRPLDLTCLDRPSFDFKAGPHIRFLIGARTGQERALKDLLSSLTAQPYPNWSIIAVAEPPLPQKSGRSLWYAPPRKNLTKLIADLPDNSLVACVGRGDVVPDYALAVLAQHALDDADSVAFYGDEDSISERGRFHNPRLRPNWSPSFEASSSYVGGSAFWRAGMLRKVGRKLRVGDFLKDGMPLIDAQRQPYGPVSHVRRILISRRSVPQPKQLRLEPTGLAAIRLVSKPAASIVIPTRDKVEFLRACINSIEAKSGDIDFEIIVVDNGSREKATHAYLNELKEKSNIQIISRPGPFNFSALCNQAADAARGRALVFLNNDTEVITQDWLARLVGFACEPGTGAVGAKLIYETGRLQHIGVVVGLGGRAGHIELKASQNAHGYLGRFSVVHEVCAVTGACLAIDRARFLSVGGFDASRLPVDLNDIDLCLRLREAGLTNLLVPDCVLVHHESASRGRSAQPSKRYASERDYFVRRWGDEIRDDPYFHPALSLNSLRYSLG